ncbi:MAG TPA: SDR family NAD(P)-dependent oxidoreductase, partial [Acidimicrobiales bacterium]
ELDQLGGPGAAPSSLPAPATPTASGADPTAAPEGSAALGLPAGTPDAPAPAPALAPAAPAANGNGNGRGHQPVPAAPSPATATAVADPPLLDVILAVVADRTGYPVEMLDPDLDLEADLSIDSIKRIEIVGELAERVGLPGSDDGAGLDEAVVEQLAQLKTLRSIVTWIESATAGAPGTPATTDGQAAAAPTAPTPASHGDDAATAPADGPGPARPGVTAAEGVDTDPAAAAPAGPGAGQQAVAPGPAPSGTTARRPAGPTVAGSPAAGPLPDRRGTTGQAGPAAGGPAVAPRPGRAPGATAAGPARQPDVAPRPAGDQPPHGTPGEATEPRAAEPGDEPGRRAGSAGPGADRANAGPTEAEVEAEARERDRKDGPARAGGTPPVAVSPGPPLASVAHMPGSVAVPGGRVASGEKEPPVTRRYVLETAMLAPALPVASAAGRTFVLVSDPWEGLDELRRLLERSGATVEVVPTHRGAPARPLPDDVAARLARADGVVHLGAAGTDPVDARDVFAALKPAVTGQATTLVAAVARRASLPPTTVSGVPGLMRSLARELPDRHVRSVELDGDRLNAHLVARLLADEALDPAGPVTISYLEGKRTTRRLAKGADLGTDTPAAPFDAESVVVFTGGARGITARAALAIARESRCRIELLGRSPLPGEEDLRTAAALDRPALRRALLEDGELRTPAAIEAACDRILADREIRHTMAQLRALGSPTTYHSVDVRDGERLARVLAEIREYHGRIDAVVHGAGVLDDRLARDKTDAGFDRVFATKVDGARTLVEHLDDDIRLVVFFGSVSGVFGNRGQVDYGAANDALDELALRLDGVDGRRVISIDWGPWGGAPGDGAGTGMVSPELEREYARRGIGLIQPDEGVRALLAEMGTLPGEPAQVVVMRADPAAMEGRPGTPGSWTGPG